MKEDAKFGSLYKFTFNFAQEKDLRNVETELACNLWELLLSPKCQFMEKWKTFIMGKKDNAGLNVITKDTWDLFYDLVKETGGKIENFEDNGAWPILIDEFVEFVNQ